MFGQDCKESSELHLRRGWVKGQSGASGPWSASSAIAHVAYRQAPVPQWFVSGLVLHGHLPDEHDPESWSSSPEVSFPEA